VVGASPPGATGDAVTADVLDAAVRHLTPFFGPISKVVVKRTASRATGVRHFYQLLAQELSNPRDRRAFLLSAGQPDA